MAVKTDLACTFCGLPKGEVSKLVAGPGVFICGDCVAFAEQVVHDAQAISPDRAERGRNTMACSFCAKPAAEVDRLVVGPDVRICDQCVRLCVEVIAAQPG
jgi:ATP-dependent protease Clp ATPase subunit